MATNPPISPCEPRLLCSSAVGAVTQCVGCGQVQVNLSYLTVRLEPAAFQALAGMLTMALQGLDLGGSQSRGAPASTPAVGIH